MIKSIPCLRQKSRKTYPGWPHVPIKPLVREYPGPPGHKHSYNSAYNSESDSVTCENQPFLKQTHVPSQEAAQFSVCNRTWQIGHVGGR